MGPLEVHKSLLIKSVPCLFKCGKCGVRMPQGCWSSNECEVCGYMEQEFIHNQIPRSQTFNQDLWVMYLIYVKNNMSELLDIQCGTKTHRRSYFNKQTVTLSCSPLRFAFLAAWFAGDVSIYDNYVSLARHRLRQSQTLHGVNKTFKYLLKEKLPRKALVRLIFESSV